MDVFLKELGKASSVTDSTLKLVLRSGQLKPGMTLSSDLITRNGELLLSKEHVLNEQLIDQINSFEKMDGHLMTVYVYDKV